MSGAGLIGGRPTYRLVGIRPDDTAYDDHQGMVYHEQDEDEVAFYEIEDTDDILDVDFSRFVSDMLEPTVVFNTAWGPTDFTIIERETDEELIEELSGFDADTWIIDLTAVDPALRITDFDTDEDVDGTQAAWLAYVGLFDRV